MSFYRTRSSSDVSPTGINLFSPFRGARADPFRFNDESPMGSNTAGSSFFPEPAFLRGLSFTLNSPMSKCDSLTGGETTAGTYSDDECVSDSQDADVCIPLRDTHSPDTQCEKFADTKPWERISADELRRCVRQLPEHLRTPEYRVLITVGLLEGILRFYISQLTQSGGKWSPNRVVNGNSPMIALINTAISHDLGGVAWYLHLEATGQIPMRPEHRMYIQFTQERNRRSRTQPRKKRKFTQDTLSVGPGESSIRYFPGITLKLGKERDTLIRPMITAVFRANKEAFKAALLARGLKYGELRMWKDAQLCTAIHVADSFKPGIWKAATDLHMHKCKRSQGPN
jgi:hypothetical protein